MTRKLIKAVTLTALLIVLALMPYRQTATADTVFELMALNRLGLSSNDGTVTFPFERTSGSYTLLTYALVNGDRGQVLFSGTTMLTGGGGSLASRDLAEYGVPPQNAYELIFDSAQEANVSRFEGPPGDQCINDVGSQYGPATNFFNTANPPRQVSRTVLPQYWTSFYDYYAADTWNPVIVTAYYAAGYYSRQGNQRGWCVYATS